MSTAERGIDRLRIERVARMYSSNGGASQALGITPRSFSRLCRQHSIETPHSRNRRQRDGVIHEELAR
jgi:hypothetical protein